MKGRTTNTPKTNKAPKAPAKAAMPMKSGGMCGMKKGGMAKKGC